MSRALSSTRVAELFRVLRVVIPKIVHDAHATTACGVRDVATDRRLADDWRDAANVQELHTLCHRLIAEREMLAHALESLRRTLANVDIVYRLDNVGRRARGKERMAKAALDSTTDRVS